MGVKLQSALGGSVELNAPSTASNFTMTVPAGNGTVATTDQLANFRNRIINGDMRIDQRGMGVSRLGNATDGFTVDRWRFDSSNPDRFTSQQLEDGPAGFKHSIRVTTTTAFSPTAAQFFSQNIEGYNVQEFKFGSSSALTFTFSFWVKASIAGTYSLAFTNNSNNYNYPTTYVVSSANTWEYKTVTVTGPTAGSWGSTNEVGLRVKFNLGSSSVYDGTANTWVAQDRNTVAGTVAISSTLNAYLQFTGVQLEMGSVATPFEYRPMPQELTMCERYYQRTDWWGRGTNHYLEDGSWNARSGMTSHVKRNGYYDAFWNYRIEMRADPTVVYYGSTAINKVRVEIPGVNNKESTINIEAASAGRNGIYIRHNELVNGADGEWTSSSGNAMLRVNLELKAEL